MSLPRSAVHAMLLAALSVGSPACTDPDAGSIRQLVPEAAVAPEAVAFGERAVPLTHSETFFLSNGGRAVLEFGMGLRGEQRGAFELPVTQGEIDPGDSLELEVLFTPDTFLDYGAELVIASNDDDTPEIVVPLSGTGVAAPLPDLAVSTQTLDFGEVEAPASEVLLLTNVGTAPLHLGEVTRQGSGSFDLLTDPTGNTIAPGDELPVVVTYDPPTPDGDSGTLVFASDDPDEPELPVLLLGNGGADYAYPEAVIDCPAQTDPPGFVDLDGSDSTDPEGHLPLDYEWTLVEVPTDPLGNAISDAYLTNAVSDSTDLFADAVGTYAVELVVVNQLGTRSAPARCTLDAVPDEQILVELSWDTPNADVDLHLAETGAALFERPGDTNWCNPSPDWGDGNTSADDPSLDLDDRAGFGPENINIDVPADGPYDVRVHYYEDQGDDIVTATVRVYLEGEITPAFQASRLMDRNEVWSAARINWPQATVGALSADNVEAEDRQCFTP